MEILPCILCGEETSNEDAVCSKCRDPEPTNGLKEQLKQVTMERDVYKELFVTIIRRVSQKPEMQPIKHIMEKTLKEVEK